MERGQTQEEQQAAIPFPFDADELEELENFGRLVDTLVEASEKPTGHTDTIAADEQEQSSDNAGGTVPGEQQATLPLPFSAEEIEELENFVRFVDTLADASEMPAGQTYIVAAEEQEQSSDSAGGTVQGEQQDALPVPFSAEEPEEIDELRRTLDEALENATGQNDAIAPEEQEHSSDNGTCGTVSGSDGSSRVLDFQDDIDWQAHETRVELFLAHIHEHGVATVAPQPPVKPTISPSQSVLQHHTATNIAQRPDAGVPHDLGTRQPTQAGSPVAPASSDSPKRKRDDEDSEVPESKQRR